MKREEIERKIIETLKRFDEIAITNPYYNKNYVFQDKIELIKELEEKYNCEIDMFYNIKFKEVE